MLMLLNISFFSHWPVIFALSIDILPLFTTGVEYPCTMIRKTAHWFLPSHYFWGVSLGFLYFNRFSELLVHKPGETLLLKFLATMLSPLVYVLVLIFECAYSYNNEKCYTRSHSHTFKYTILFDTSVKIKIRFLIDYC
jgi:hypothetical protein